MTQAFFIKESDVRSFFGLLTTASIWAGLLFVTVGCANTEYIGDSYAPTEIVDIFYDEAMIPTDYTTIGQALGTGVWVRNRKIQDKLLEEARNRGADAILITGLGQSHIPLDVDSSAREKQINASFLKYR